MHKHFPFDPPISYLRTYPEDTFAQIPDNRCSRLFRELVKQTKALLPDKKHEERLYVPMESDLQDTLLRDKSRIQNSVQNMILFVQETTRNTHTHTIPFVKRNNGRITYN